jgi:hypothetical protein
MAIPLPITPSLLNVFLTCPRQYQAKYITKEVVFQQNEAAKQGDIVHKRVEAALKKGTPLTPGVPPDYDVYVYSRMSPSEVAAARDMADEAAATDVTFMQPMVDWCRMMAAQPGMTMYVEHKMCITRNFEPTTWLAKPPKKPWLRGIADVFFKDDAHQLNINVDWKTGKPKHDKTQSRILSLCARHNTGYTKTLNLWVHVKHGQLMMDSLDLVDLAPVQSLLLDVARYEQACAADQYPAIRNGLCGQWCDVLSCPHNGKNGG